MDYKPFLKRIEEAGATMDGIDVMLDCTAAIMNELNESLNPRSNVFLPCVIAALDRLKNIQLIDEDDEGKEKIQRMANSLNRMLQVAVQVERVQRRDME